MGRSIPIDRVFADPQVQSLGIAQSVLHPELGGRRSSDSPSNCRVRRAASRPRRRPTARTPREVLRELGYDPEIAGLRAGAL